MGLVYINEVEEKVIQKVFSVRAETEDGAKQLAFEELLRCYPDETKFEWNGYAVILLDSEREGAFDIPDYDPAEPWGDGYVKGFLELTPDDLQLRFDEQRKQNKKAKLEEPAKKTKLVLTEMENIAIKVLCSERTWGAASPVALWSIYEQNNCNLDYVMHIIRSEEFKQGHLPGIRLYKLIQNLQDQKDKDQVTALAAELGMEVVKYDGL